MFEVSSYSESDTCLNCEKTTECLQVKCLLGTFSGPLCSKCLVRETKKRTKTARHAQRPAAVPTALPALNAK